jgi:uncharacterized 2Fe-2S/4Fe-4S cluster protein (DUF4445 family)
MSEPLVLQIALPQGEQTLHIRRGEEERPLTETLRRDNLPLNTRCGQRGLCRGCVVELIGGSLTHRQSGEVIRVSDSDAPLAIRACEYSLRAGKASLRIPARALLAYEPQVVTDFRLNVPRAHDPLCPSAPLGVAVDIGTTTVAVLLVDLADGRVLAQSGGFNKQMNLGDDVLTRINLCMTDPVMLQRLQELVVRETLAPLLEKSLEDAGAEYSDIGCLVMAGNSTMQHLVAGIDPSPMGVAPFIPHFLEHRILSSREIGLNVVSPTTEVHLLPSCAAYIGADLSAGILSSGLLYDDGPSLLVDVGTNGEIVLKIGDRLYGCATAAGPAFEGAGLECGVRAGVGAVSHLSFDGDPFAVEAEVIPSSDKYTRPAGICGTAYIDLLARGRTSGLLSPTGRFTADLPDEAGHWLFTDEFNRRCLRVTRRRAHSDIFVTELDIARLLQAKAAIAAGILTLLERVGVAPADIKTLHLAGGFGLHLDVQSAIESGLLPGFQPQQIEVVGNTSLAGAYLALLDRSTLAEMERARQSMEVIELNLDPNFEMRYIDQLSLP